MRSVKNTPFYTQWAKAVHTHTHSSQQNATRVEQCLRRELMIVGLSDVGLRKGLRNRQISAQNRQIVEIWSNLGRKSSNLSIKY